MRDEAFIILPHGPLFARRPVALRFDASAPPAHRRRWLVEDADGDVVAHARTRAGGRLAVLAFYGA